MNPLVKQIGDWVVWAVGVGGALVVIFKLILKPVTQPLDELKTQISKLQTHLTEVDAKLEALQKGTTEKLSVLEQDTGDLLCDRLSQSHEQWMRRGYCPHSEKERLVKMYRRYHDMGRNHLSASYEQDIIGLPENPPTPVLVASVAAQGTKK